MQNTTIKLKGLGFLKSSAIFSIAALLLYIETQFFIPLLNRATGWEPIICWFFTAGLFIFFPMLILSYIILKREGLRLTKEVWTGRLRFAKLSGRDWYWTLGGLLTILILSGVLSELLKLILETINHQPPFMQFEPLTSGRYWILLLWLPYWSLNIMGEEVLWRGVLFPRQEAAFGKLTWVVHGLLWGVFHIAFGWQLLVTLIPTLFIQSYIVQKTKKSWSGVIIHAGLNGPAFIAIALGLI